MKCYEKLTVQAKSCVWGAWRNFEMSVMWKPCNWQDFQGIPRCGQPLVSHIFTLARRELTHFKINRLRRTDFVISGQSVSCGGEHSSVALSISIFHSWAAAERPFWIIVYKNDIYYLFISTWIYSPGLNGHMGLQLKHRKVYGLYWGMLIKGVFHKTGFSSRSLYLADSNKGREFTI